MSCTRFTMRTLWIDTSRYVVMREVDEVRAEWMEDGVFERTIEVQKI